MSVTIARWTISDYHTVIATGLFESRPIELLNGLMVEMSSEGLDHAESSSITLEFLMGIAQGRYRVRAAKPITIPISNSEPEPDIAIVKNQSYRQAHPRPEEVYLIIEFSHTSLSKDTEDKRKIYAGAEIQDYWVVNLRDRQVIVYRQPVHGDYQVEQRFTSGSLSLPAFPDIVLEVSTLLS